MAIIAPFRGIHYDSTKVPDGSDVAIPPYDNIPAGEEKKYLARSPYNFAHVLLPQSADDDYSRSKKLLTKWREIGVLVEDPSPAYYLYQQDFTVKGVLHRRQSLMCAVLLVDFAEAVVRPHENTFGQYKADRLRILRATGCNLSHVFGMVKDEGGYLNRAFEPVAYQKPLTTGKTDDGTAHAVWRVDAATANGITTFFADKPIYIVDGHHRYESALNHAKELGVVGKKDHPAAYMLFSIANTYDPALVVLPTHRRVKGQPKLDELSKKFELKKLTRPDLDKFLSKPTAEPSFAMYADHELWRVTPKHWQSEESTLGPSLARLAVVWSDHKLMKDYLGVDDSNRSARVSYFKDPEELWLAKDSGDMLVFHAPPAVEDVTRVADEKRFMPQKSTYFFPKLAAGFVFRAIS